jgi:hypothetical protein
MDEDGHESRESTPPGGLVEVLSRWEESGGQWRVLGTGTEWIEVGLFACDGKEEMSRVSGARTSVLRSYLGGRLSSAD